MPTRPPRLRSGYVSCGPDPNQRRSSGSGRDLERPSRRARGRQARRGASRSPRRRCRRRRGRCRRPRAGRRCRSAGRELGAHDGRVAPSRSMPTSRRSSRSTPSVRPARRHPADPVVVGRGTPQRQGRGGGQQRMDEPAVRVERRRCRSGPASAERSAGAVAAAPTGSCRAQTSKPAGAQGRSRGGRDADRQERLAAGGPRRDPARERHGRPLAGSEMPAGRTRRRRPRRHRPSASSSPGASRGR